jgi:hypothetical protein
MAPLLSEQRPAKAAPPATNSTGLARIQGNRIAVTFLPSAVMVTLFRTTSD